MGYSIYPHTHKRYQRTCHHTRPCTHHEEQRPQQPTGGAQHGSGGTTYCIQWTRAAAYAHSEGSLLRSACNSCCRTSTLTAHMTCTHRYACPAARMRPGARARMLVGARASAVRACVHVSLSTPAHTSIPKLCTRMRI